MADYGLLGDLGQGFNALSAGYMQGVRDREDRDMRMQQFNQQQQMAGLQYDMLRQRQEQSAKMQKYANAAEAVVMGNYGKAVQLHNELGGNDVASIEPIDNDNVRITYSDGSKESVIPRIQYAQVVASRGNPEQMIKSINSIAQGQRIQEAAKANVEAKASEAERTRQFKAEEAEKARTAKEAEWKTRFQTQYDIAKMRAASAGKRGGSGGGLSAFEKKFNLYKTQLMKNQGMTEQDAANEALRLSTPGADTERTRRGDIIRIESALVKEGGQAGKEAKKRLEELRGEVATPKRQSSQGAPSAPKPGMVKNGYRFKGGNPADKNSWEKL